MNTSFLEINSHIHYIFANMIKNDLFKYSLSIVKKSDFDSYLGGLLFPKSSIESFFAIRAFNCEIAQIRELSKHNFMTGKLRFQFWKDILSKIYNKENLGNLIDNPLVKSLDISIRKHNLTRRYFDRCIEARQNDYADIRFETISDAEWYAETSHSSLM